MTSAQLEGLYFAAECPYSHLENTTNRVYAEMPSDPDQLDSFMCGPHNRKGLLCGRCIDGYGPAVYSLDRKCVNCSQLSTASASSVYILLELIPITVMFVCVMLFHLDITAGPLLGYVIFCQVYAYSVERNVYITSYIFMNSSVPLKMLLYCSLALSGIWNLKFAWILIPPFCISSALTGIHIELLGLVSPIVLIVLFIVTCISIDLHRRDNRIIKAMWRLFRFFLTKIKIKSVSGDSVIHSFASFVLLSAYTLNYVMITTFTYNPVFYNDGTFYNYLVFFDPTIKWLSHEHIIYISITVIPFIVLVIIPSVLLCAYPTRLYCFLSRLLSARKRLAIKAFVEALHNCFKDGLNGTRDYRQLAGLSILVGIIYPLIDYYFWKIAAINYSFSVTSGFTLTIVSLFLSYARPCKSVLANLSLSYHIMVMGMLSIAVSLWKKDLSTKTETLKVLFIITPVISHVLVISWAGYTITCQILSRIGHQGIVE